MRDRQYRLQKILEECESIPDIIEHLTIVEDTRDIAHDKINSLQAENEKLKELLNTINEHAESCSIFIYDDKDCTCFYSKVLELREEK